MRFFEPTRKYILWLERYVDERPVIELGCGDGYFTYLMRAIGIRAMGLDPFKDGEFLDCTSFMDVPAYQFSAIKSMPMLLVTARPDHSGWVTNVPYYMHADSELLYVGLSKNVESDMHTLSYEEVEAPNPKGYLTLSIKKHDGSPPNPEINLNFCA